jgi:hypothetical protein
MRSCRFREPHLWTMALLALALDLGCRPEAGSESRKDPKSVALTPAPPAAPVAALLPSQLELLNQLPSCEIDHHGLVIDLGQTDGKGRGGATKERVTDRGGSTFLVVSGRRSVHEFWVDEPLPRLTVTARVVGQAASALSLIVDNRRVSRQKLAKGEVKMLRFAALSEVLEPGPHTLTLEAHGRAPSPDQPFFELDYLHLGRGDELPEGGFVPPTRRDVVAEHEIDNVPRRSIVLRAPSRVRCPLHVGTRARLEVGLGFWGTGHGVGEIRLLEDGQAPVTLAERKVIGGQGSQWIPLSVDLSPYANRVIALELGARKTTEGGRMAFGEPKLVRPPANPVARPPAQVVVVVVLSRVARRDLPPWGSIQDLAAFAELRRDALTYNAYRVPTDLPGAVLASLLSGFRPPGHGLTDPSARIRPSTRLLSDVLRETGVRTGMFTGVPNTFEAFGFDSGWDRFASYSPVRDLPAESPVTDATRWLAEQLDQQPDRTVFALLHLRGTHPPWDLSAEEAGRLPPADYDGIIDPRRGGITLGRLERQSSRVLRRLTEDDWERLRALGRQALIKQARAVGQLFHLLRERELWDKSLVVLMGDVASLEPPNPPFDPNPGLREEALGVPLLVKLPGRIGAGQTVDYPVTTVDLTRTLQATLSPSTDPLGALDLFELASGWEPVLGRALLAESQARYSTRLGSTILSADSPSSVRLCQADIDPACIENRFRDHPLLGRALKRWSEAALLAPEGWSPSHLREPAGLDPETAAALVVWGDIEQ